MKEHDRAAKKSNRINTFETVKTSFQIWAPLFQRLGFKPRRFFTDSEAVYVSTQEGWFRLGLAKYSKTELNWLRNILEYLEARSFMNWAVPWQKTVIWEEKAFCYLIQPWRPAPEYFRADDPASITRIAEILTNLYESGKDYIKGSQMEVSRNNWRKMDVEWETAIQKLEDLKIEDFYEKVREEVNDLRKAGIEIYTDIVKNWRTSGIHSLFEAQRQTGILGHGNLLARYLIWREDDYYLLNWESLAFQPRVRDLATLINDIGVWEPEWMIFLINACSRLRPFWPEEYQALMVLLKEPKDIIGLLETVKEKEFDRKTLKEVVKGLNKKNRCLEKVWYELGSEKRWPALPVTNYSGYHSRELSMVLSPVETWGGFHGGPDSLIQISDEHPNLPREIMERLAAPSPGRVGSGTIVGGNSGNILESAGTIPESPERGAQLDSHFKVFEVRNPGSSEIPQGPVQAFETFQTVKPVPSIPSVQPVQPVQSVPLVLPAAPPPVGQESITHPPVNHGESLDKTKPTIPAACRGESNSQCVVENQEQEPAAQDQTTVVQKRPETIRWEGFPKKKNGAGKRIGG